MPHSLQQMVGRQGSKEEGSLLLDEDSMGYERVDEPGFATLSVHSILCLASLFSDERVVIESEGGPLVHGHDPVSDLLWVHGKHGGVGRRGIHALKGVWRVVRVACIPRCMGSSWKPWCLAAVEGRC